MVATNGDGKGVVITRSHGSVVRTTIKVNGKRGNLTPAPQKPLNRWSPKFVWVTTSVMCTTTQNFIQIGLGVSVLRTRDFVPLGTKQLGYFFEKGKATAETRALILTQNTSNDLVTLTIDLLTLNSCRTRRVTCPTLPPNLKTLRLFVQELRVITVPIA